MADWTGVDGISWYSVTSEMAEGVAQEQRKSSMCILTPVFSVIALIVAPPLPIIAPRRFPGIRNFIEKVVGSSIADK